MQFYIKLKTLLRKSNNVLIDFSYKPEKTLYSKAALDQAKNLIT